MIEWEAQSNIHWNKGTAEVQISTSRANTNLKGRLNNK